MSNLHVASDDTGAAISASKKKSVSKVKLKSMKKKKLSSKAGPAPAEEPPFEAPAVEEAPFEAPPGEEPPFDAPPAEEPPFDAPPVEEDPFEAPPVEEPPFEVFAVQDEPLAEYASQPEEPSAAEEQPVSHSTIEHAHPNGYGTNELSESTNAEDSEDRNEMDRGFDPSDEIIALQVGPPLSRLYVHRSILCKYSSFMQTKTKSEWLGSKPHVDLPGHAPEVVRTYVNWLYNSKLPGMFEPEDVSVKYQPQLEQAFRELARCYVFGNHILDPLFQNDIISAMGALFKRVPDGAAFFSVGSEVVWTLYNGTPESSPSRRFLADIYGCHASEADFMANGSSVEGSDAFPPQFLWDISRILLSIQKPDAPGKFTFDSDYLLDTSLAQHSTTLPIR